MTPVEERIDHEEAKGTAQQRLEHLLRKDSPLLSVEDREVRMLRAYLALLTEHSAREDQLRNLRKQAERVLHQHDVDRMDQVQTGSMLDHELRGLRLAVRIALPATEPAQPEQAQIEAEAREYERRGNAALANGLASAAKRHFVIADAIRKQMPVAQPEEER